METKELTLLTTRSKKIDAQAALLLLTGDDIYSLNFICNGFNLDMIIKEGGVA